MFLVCSNGINSILKFIAWLYTGSHSMFAEFIHSVADTMNQVSALTACSLSSSTLWRTPWTRWALSQHVRWVHPLCGGRREPGKWLKSVYELDDEKDNCVKYLVYLLSSIRWNVWTSFSDHLGCWTLPLHQETGPRSPVSEMNVSGISVWTNPLLIILFLFKKKSELKK